MRKIDKTLKEVRGWKRKVSAKLKKMSLREEIAYFRAKREARLQHRPKPA